MRPSAPACFIVDCCDPATNRNKFCTKHTRVVEAMAKSARTKEEKATWKLLLNDATALTEEVATRIRENPTVMLPYARLPYMEFSSVAERLRTKTYAEAETIYNKLGMGWGLAEPARAVFLWWGMGEGDMGRGFPGSAPFTCVW